jgi:hypothetical protein
MILACLLAHSGAAVGSVCPADTGRHFANFTVENRHALRLCWGAAVSGPATSMIGTRLSTAAGGHWWLATRGKITDSSRLFGSGRADSLAQSLPARASQAAGCLPAFSTIWHVLQSWLPRGTPQAARSNSAPKPLHVSTPREAKSRLSASLTHSGCVSAVRTSAFARLRGLAQGPK